MLATIRQQHPSLAKPPVSGVLAVPAPSLLALLRSLDSLAGQTASTGVDTEGEDAMDIDQLAQGEDRFGEGYLVLLEHALVRCGTRREASHICSGNWAYLLIVATVSSTSSTACPAGWYPCLRLYQAWPK
jgi:hypothetical protein